MRKIILLFGMLIAFLAFTHIESKAQVKNLLSTYSLSTDTVTNAGTSYLTVQNKGEAGATTIQVNVTKVSGTVGGTISLLGSLDGTNFKALNTEETQTALATITATDANNVYHWRLNGNPFLYYRVSWTGTGTMVATFSASLLSR
jgi:pheromone shutdown protein TraB